MVCLLSIWVANCHKWSIPYSLYLVTLHALLLSLSHSLLLDLCLSLHLSHYCLHFSHSHPFLTFPRSLTFANATEVDTNFFSTQALWCFNFYTFSRFRPHLIPQLPRFRALLLTPLVFSCRLSHSRFSSPVMVVTCKLKIDFVSYYHVLVPLFRLFTLTILRYYLFVSLSISPVISMILHFDLTRFLYLSMSLNLALSSHSYPLSLCDFASL